MDSPYVYEFRVEGHLADRWSEWFKGLAICKQPDGETTLTGLLVDQAALFGVLIRIHDLNLVLISLTRVPSIGYLDKTGSDFMVLYRSSL